MNPVRFLAFIGLLIFACLSAHSQTFSIEHWLKNNQPTPVELSPDGAQVLWYNSELKALELQWVTDKRLKRFNLRPQEVFIDAHFIRPDYLLLATRNDDRFRVYGIQSESASVELLIEQEAPLSIAGDQISTRGFWILTQHQSQFFDFVSRQLSLTRPVPEQTYALKYGQNEQPCLALTEQGDIWWWQERQWRKLKPKMPLVRVEVTSGCQQIFAIGQTDNTRALVQIAENQSSKVLFRHPDYDTENFWIDRSNQSIAGIFYHAQLPKFVAASERSHRLSAIINQFSPNANWTILDQSHIGPSDDKSPAEKLPANKSSALNHDRQFERGWAAGDIFLVRVESPTLPPTHLWINSNSGSLVVLNFVEQSPSDEWLNTRVVETQVGRLTVGGYLTLPARVKSTTPIMVRLHGGPYAVRDYWRFDPEAQWFASRGVALLSINYRGSAGFGLNYQKVAYGRLRETLEQDIDALLDEVKEDYGLKDAPICLYGASFGGFAALSELIENPADYRCGILVSGVVSLPLVYGALQTQEDRENFRQTFGSPDNESWYNRNNLLTQLNRVKVPILVVYGDGDRKVSPQHSEQLVAGLRGLNKPVSSRAINGAGHQLERIEDRILLYETIADFLHQQSIFSF
jgi:alpha-beta hydrolase superfamily lysophospholipase